MRLYELLGVDKTATMQEVKAAYRKAAKTAHPDQGGDAEKFTELQEAFEVLSDPARRARYDATGRTDISKVTPKAIQEVIEGIIVSCVDAQDKNGATDNPSWVNIRENILLSMQRARVEMKDRRFNIDRRLTRANEILARFRRMSEGSDLVGDALRKKVLLLIAERNEVDDAMELSQEAEKVFREYVYEVGPQAEGQYTQRPTSRRSGVQFISQSSIFPAGGTTSTI